MTTHEILVAARNLIDREGWRQNALHGDGFCINGALNMALHGTVLFGRSADADERSVGTYDAACALRLPPTGNVWAALGGVSKWNDAPGRTKEEVLAAFDRAIAATAPEPDVSFVTAPEEVAVP